MTIRLDHVIIPARDKRVSARFLTDLFGLAEATSFGPFLAVQVGPDLTLDYTDLDPVAPGLHYAFLVGEDEFDAIFGRIRERGLTYWADPHQQDPGEINHNDGGRGVYFDDPDGHRMEIITRRYGGGPVT